MPVVDAERALEQLPDAVVAADTRDRVVYVNGAAERLLGWPRAELVGRELTEIQPPRLRVRHRAGLRRLLETGEPRVLDVPLRVAALRRDGTEVDIELTITRQSGKDGDIFVASMRELRDRVELERERATRVELESALRRSTFLREAATVLSSSLHYETTLTRVARLAVPNVADWCAVDLVESDGNLRRLAITHADPDKERLAAEITRRYPVSASAPRRVVSSGRPELVAEVSDTLLADAAHDTEHLRLLREIGLSSYVCVPLRARGRVVGALTCATSGPSRRFDEHDLTMIEGLAQTAALAIDNARLVADLRAANEAKEESLALLDSLFASAPIGLGFFDTQLRHVRVNAALAEMNGYPEQELIGRKPSELHGETGERAEALYRQVLQSGEPMVGVELSGTTSSDPDRPRHWRLSYYPVRRSGADTLGLGLIVSDISDRKANEERLARISRLYAVLAATNEAVMRSSDWAGLLAQVCRIGVDVGGFRMVWAGMLDQTTRAVRPVAHAGAEDGYLEDVAITIGAGERGRGPSGRALLTGQGSVSHDIANDPMMAPWRNAALERGYRSCASFPLRIGDQVIGTINFYSAGLGFFADEGVALVADVADNVSFGLEALNREERRRRAEQALAQERTFLDVVLHNLTDGVVACDAGGNLTIFNRATQSLHAIGMGPVPPERWAEHHGLFRPDGVTPLAREEIPLYRALQGEQVRNVETVIAPHTGDRRVVLNNGQPLYDAHGNKLGAVVTMHDITERKQAEAQLTRQALHDPLTALPNRLLLLDRLRLALARARRRPGSVAVLFLDFDRFKVINDSLGHDVGDRALVAIAERLLAAVRPSDTVARLGGDEFVVLCEDIAGAEEAARLSARLEAAVATPPLLQLPDTTVVLTASVGIAIADGDEHAENLLRKADMAMYRAKQRGKARHEVFDDTFRLVAVDRLQTEHALRRALEHDGLRLLYQPIVDVRSGALVGAEALVRYDDPDRGLVAPADFLDVAEDSGLIVPIGAWALREGCAQLHRWRREPGGERLRLSVNLSARQLAVSDLVESLEETLAAQDLPPEALGLEITETALMESSTSTLRTLDHLKRVGSQLGIDDFGTGYSSLTYLRRFPVDFVKVDRSFVSGLGTDAEDTAIVTAVVSLGRALGLKTVAEGVETSEQLQLLRELDCDLAQGYHFGRPQSAEAICDLVVDGARW